MSTCGFTRARIPTCVLLAWARPPSNLLRENGGGTPGESSKPDPRRSFTVAPHAGYPKGVSAERPMGGRVEADTLDM
jgi:hypothetical protein